MSSVVIAVIDIGVGNIGSVLNMLKVLGAKGVLVSTAEQLESAEKIILPGVGSFDNAMDILNYQNLRGGDVSISNIPMPIFVILNNNTSSLFQAIYYILNLELHNYNTLLVNHNISRDTGLKTFQDQFIKKQLRLHNKLRLLLRQLDRVGNNGIGLTLMDDDMYDRY